MAVLFVLLALMLITSGNSFQAPDVIRSTSNAINGGYYREGTVYIDGHTVKYVDGSMKNDGAAYGFYNNSIQTNGWGILEIKAGYGKTTTNVDILYAAGYLEGVLTAEQIWQNYQNMNSYFLKNRDEKTLKNLKNFVTAQDTWVDLMISKHNGTDPFWRHVGYVRAQLLGLYAGYSSVAHPSWDTDLFMVQLLNLAGDLLDLITVVDSSSQPNLDKMTPHEIYQYVTFKGHCSALIKVMGAYEDMFMGHSSWFTYSATMRIYKMYDFNVDDPATSAKKMAFSSYAGYLESLDDYYQLSSNMVLLQTTNNIFDTSLYRLVKPQSLFAWQRVRVANMMANSGQEWSNLIAMYNSGTYNNQYMVVDLKHVKIGEELQTGALWVAEQIPGLVVARDQTHILRMGYWPSYNVPFYEEIYNRSGYPDFVKKRGLNYSYQLAPRAKIFRRDQAKVTDLQAMKDILRYNDYLHDPYSENSSCNTICCRGDLDDENPRPDGCYDTKVSDVSMALDLQSDIISGPTQSHGLPPFSWTGIFASAPHVGLPDEYNFDWIRVKPEL